RPGGPSEDKNLPTYRTVVVPYGERTLVELPDSTRIWLNSGSTLVYPELFTGGQRQVYLEEEGYFDVRHNEDRPFFVQLRDMEIKVLRTEFNVSAYTDDESANVMLVKGSVELRLSGNPSSKDTKTRLAPHEVAVYRTTDRKSTRLNSSHVKISYAVFCLKKKTRTTDNNMQKTKNTR